MRRSVVWCASAFVLVLAVVPVTGRAALLISELCDPKLNYASDRFIEIYNSGPEAVDLTGWRLVAVGNGVDLFTWPLSGLIDAGQALVAGDATTVEDFPVAFPDEAWSGSTGNWNGKAGDGAKLVDPSGTVTDSVVAGGVAFENADYVRRPEVTAPNPVYTPSEWTSTPVNLATDASPGSHTTSSPTTAPVIAAVRTEPESPGASDAVDLYADVTVDGGTVSGVTALWGLAPTALPNEVPMAAFAGDTYRTASPIPAQGGGVAVYYRIRATADPAATTTSSLGSYAPARPATVHEIQGEAAASPLEGAVVATGGVVTAVFGTTFVIQDGTGPWSGIWVRGDAPPSRGDQVTVTGLVSETGEPDLAGTTMLVNAEVTSRVPGATLPAPLPVATAAAGDEPYEGVLVDLLDALCTDVNLGGGEWDADDGTGAVRVGVRGGSPGVLLGTTYRVTGAVSYGYGRFRIEPREAADVVWVADHTAPLIFSATALTDTVVLVTFSEPVEEVEASVPGHYTIPGLLVDRAERDEASADRVRLSVSPMATGDYTVAVSGVEDLYGNAVSLAAADFSYTDPGIPPGYYDSAAGLSGEPLQSALHGIIKDHTAYGYDYAWTAYRTADVRPDNGKVWDIYSDVPGGTPAYLYTFGADEGGIGGQEGTGYTREHTWCKSWFGGEVPPMYTDIFALYPCDTHMNGTRGVYPYGETEAPQLVSSNGSKVGPASVPGYAGTVFEPIDAFKGDLARVYFYFSTRYHGEDAGWPGGPATDGADLRPWALDMFLAWNAADPVSRKEIDRNNAVYAIQGNRNPFVDRPEFVDLVFGSATAVVLEARGERLAEGDVRLAWKVSDADDGDLHHVYRQDGTNRTRITSLPLSGRMEYVYRDEDAPRSKTEYWIGSRGRDGVERFTGPVEVEAWTGPSGLARLESVVPNPFAANAVITYSVAAPGPVVLEVFDCAGRRVRVLEDGPQEAGRRTVGWDGRDGRGAPVGAGVYFLRLRTAGRTQGMRIVRLQG